MKNNKRTSLLLGSFITLIICLSPYLLYMHTNVPEGALEIKTIFGTIKAGYYYPDLQIYIYYFFSKFAPLLLLLVWFITCKHWWVHAIIIPITVYLFQLISVINDNGDYVDEVTFIYTIPITLIIIVLLYFARNRISVYIQAVDLKKEMDQKMKIPKSIEQ
jgi:hypothetical protein